MAGLDFIQNFGNLFEIDLTPTAAASTWARLAAGINDVSWSGNEQVDETDYYDGEGVADAMISGGNPVGTFSGHRYFGDPAQDYIADLRYVYGDARRTNFRWTEPDGTVTTTPVTIANIVAQGGGPRDKGTFSCEIHFTGLPTVVDGSDTVFPTSITASAVSVAKNATASVGATVSPSGASPALVYSIADESKATVDSNGTVHGVAAGSTTLLIKSAVKPSITKSVTVTVTN